MRLVGNTGSSAIIPLVTLNAGALIVICDGVCRARQTGRLASGDENCVPLANTNLVGVDCGASWAWPTYGINKPVSLNAKASIFFPFSVDATPVNTGRTNTDEAISTITITSVGIINFIGSRASCRKAWTIRSTSVTILALTLTPNQDLVIGTIGLFDALHIWENSDEAWGTVTKSSVPNLVLRTTVGETCVLI